MARLTFGNFINFLATQVHRQLAHDHEAEVSTTVLTHLLLAKSRVAPIKPLIIPKLELCGALVLSKLLSRTADDFGPDTETVFAWTDSAVVLGWLQISPSRLKVFMANRVGEVFDNVPAGNWRHVATDVNRVDSLSRGKAPSQHLLW